MRTEGPTDSHSFAKPLSMALTAFVIVDLAALSLFFFAIQTRDDLARRIAANDSSALTVHNELQTYRLLSQMARSYDDTANLFLSVTAIELEARLEAKAQTFSENSIEIYRKAKLLNFGTAFFAVVCPAPPADCADPPRMLQINLPLITEESGKKPLSRGRWIPLFSEGDVTGYYQKIATYEDLRSGAQATVGIYRSLDIPTRISLLALLVAAAIVFGSWWLGMRRRAS